MKGSQCQSCGRPLGCWLMTCPYCGERIRGAMWRLGATAAGAVAVAVIAFFALPKEKLEALPDALHAMTHSQGAITALAVAATLIFAPYGRARPGTAAIGLGRRMTAIALRLFALALVAAIIALLCK